ncbi:MAG TPA: TIGR03013 family XrtA/PEP-CTERM system glycosyltransferase [Nitrospirota bacterium]|nr:TIGR03013 family XrtA/PEP-CTERM system glycosyltransferase [Nitrospirota bacterium]
MKSPLTLLIGDALLSILAVHVSSLVRFGSLEEIYPYALDAERLLVFALFAVFSSYLLELYDLEKQQRKREVFVRTLIALTVTFLMLTPMYYSVPSLMLGRGLLVLSLGFFGVFQFLLHTGYARLINSAGLARRVLVLGTGPLAKKIGDLITTTNHQHILRGYVNLTGESAHVPPESIVGNGHGLVETVREKQAQKLVVSLSERRGFFPVQDVLNCKFSGIEVIDAPSFYEEMTGKLLIENTTPSWFIFSNGFKMSASQRFNKRIFDLVFSLLGLIMTMPFLPLIALMIKVDSRGPVFFTQVRVGELEKKFLLYKFRTMRPDAENDTGAVWAQKNDARVTRLGKLLRKTRIDELPQLYNVLIGQMSFIGPRPERPEFVGELKKCIPYYSERHFVKPGVTGWAQIRYPYGASVEDAVEKLRHDLYYIKNVSFFLDVLIVIETIKVMLFGRGAR